MPTLTCQECELPSAGYVPGWRAYLVDLDDDGCDEIVCYCPSCAAREFGSRRVARSDDAAG